MGSFFTFTEVAERVRATENGEPLPHTDLAIRKHHIQGFCIRGKHEQDIGARHETAREAMVAIRFFCTSRHMTATVKVFTSDAQLYKVIQVR